MKTINLVLQGKGGAGKSFVASILAQYMKELDHDNLVLDTDPLNQSLHKITGLDAEFINLLDINRDDIDHRKFDYMIETIIDRDATHTVVDTGSNSFLQLCNYLKRHQIVTILDGFGFKVKFHFVINGGSEQNEAIKLTTEFASMLYAIDSENDRYYEDYKPLVIWLNPMPAPLKFYNEVDSFYGDKSYELMEYLIHGVIQIPAYHSNGLLRHDIFSMRDNFLTFNEFMKKSYDTEKGYYGIISKQRIAMYKRELFFSIKHIVEN